MSFAIGTAVLLAVMMTSAAAPDEVSAQTILITQPRSLKVDSPTFIVKGAVMDFDIKEIDLAVVDILDLARSQQKNKKNISRTEERINPARRKNMSGSSSSSSSWLDAVEFETVPVRNGIFQKNVTIPEDGGIYSIIAKLPGAGIPPDPQNLEIKVVVLDKTSDDIVITEPKADRVMMFRKISGRIARGPMPKSVRIVVEAISSEDGGYRLDKLFEVSAPVKNRTFSVPVSIEDMLTGDEIVIITMSTDGIAVTKTLF